MDSINRTLVEKLSALVKKYYFFILKFFTLDKSAFNYAPVRVKKSNIFKRYLDR